MKKYTINRFVNDEEGYSYFMGLLFSDGHIDWKDDIVYVMSTDLDIIEKVYNRLSYTGVINEEEARTSNRKKSYRVILCGENARYFKSMTSGSSKEDYTFKGLKREVKDIGAFLRGFLDGDGSIRVGTLSDGTKYLHGITFLGRKRIISDIQDILGEGHVKIRRPGKVDLYYLTYTGVKAKEIADLMYKNATIYLERKHKNYIETVGWVPEEKAEFRSKIKGLNYDKNLSKPWRYRKYKNGKKVIDETFYTEEDAVDFISELSV